MTSATRSSWTTHLGEPVVRTKRLSRAPSSESVPNASFDDRARDALDDFHHVKHGTTHDMTRSTARQGLPALRDSRPSVLQPTTNHFTPSPMPRALMCTFLSM